MPSRQVPVDEDDPRRVEIREWLEMHPDPSPRQLADAGWVAPHWPEPWGRSADPMTQLVIEDEFSRAGVKMPMNPNGVLFVGPSLLIGGQESHLKRYLPPMLSGEELWCRLYSEPDAGSDLTAIRTRGERRDDVLVINGWKLWAPLAQSAVLGGLLVRTSGVAGDAHGLTYIVCPMDTPGITINRVRDMAGGYRFNEIVFDDVELPVDYVVGEIDEGLDVARSRHRFERVSIARGVAFGNGPAFGDLLDFVRGEPQISDPFMRHRLVAAHVESEILRMWPSSIAAQRARGVDTDLAERARKIMLERHGYAVGLLACDVLGAGGTVYPDPDAARRVLWYNQFLGAPSIRIGAGTIETQLDTLGDLLMSPNATR